MDKYLLYRVDEGSEYIRVLRFEYDTQEVRDEKKEEFIRKGCYCYNNIEDIDLQSIDNLESKPLVITDFFLISRKDKKEDIKIDEIIYLCNKFDNQVKNIIIQTDNDIFDEYFPDGVKVEDYYYNRVTKKLLNKYDQINNPAKIKCTKDRQSGDWDHISSLDLVKIIDDIIEIEVNNIKEYNFTPLEKIIAAAMIAINLVPMDWEKFDNDQNNVGSDIYDSIYTNSIKCAGFSDIFIRFCKKLGVQTELETFRTRNGRVRHGVAITHLNDEIYNIEGDYLIDITLLSNFIEFYLKENHLNYISFFDSLTLIENIKLNTSVKLQVFGLGKDKYNAYVEQCGGIKEDTFILFGGFENLKDYVPNISDASIPLQVLKQAADYVESKIVENKLSEIQSCMSR